MVSIILIVLFICQLLSFFFIILLNSKLARFRDLEARQEQIVREMDDAIGLHLMEMKEENDRLIKELKSGKQTSIRGHGNSEETDTEAHLSAGEDAASREPEVTAESRKPHVPIAFATNAYSRQKQQDPADKQPVQKGPGSAESSQEQGGPSHLASFEREVLEMHRAGKTIEEIAKETQKGKTEIELLIKFHA